MLYYMLQIAIVLCHNDEYDSNPCYTF